MADGYIVNDKILYNIADAIRNKNGESTLYRPQDMADAILDIEPNISLIDRTITIYSNSIINIIGNSAFQNCASLTTVNLPNVTSIGDNAFDSCGSLTSITLSSSTVCSLNNVNAFSDTPIESGTGYIYVPAELVDTYKAATNWSTYASQIVAISE